MRAWIAFFILFCGIGALAPGQKGSAPSGFYPSDYSGDTFKGSLIEADEDRLVLEYSHGSKSERFEGKIAAPCIGPTKSGSKQLHLTVIPKGTVLTAFYNIVKVNVPSGTEKAVSILAIRFEELHGQKVSNPDRPVVPCSTFNGRVKALDGSTN